MEPKQQTRPEFIKGLFNLVPEDNIHVGKNGRERLISGIRKGFEAIKGSYGASGSNVIVETDLLPYTKTTNDGRAILDEIKLSDPVENMGLNILKEVARKSDAISGDGRKTSVILTQAIIAEGLKEKANPMEIKKSLEEALPTALKSIDDQTKKITTHDIKAIATVASESPYLGSLFQEIYTQIGKDGILELGNSPTPETTYEITHGVRLRGCGFQWSYMANSLDHKTAEYTNPYVLIVREKIAHIGELDKILKRLYEAGTSELVIFCDDIDPKVSEALAYLHLGQGPDGKPMQAFKTLVIKAPTLWKDWLFDDLSKITGGKIVGSIEAPKLKNFQLSWLGKCGKIVTSKEETVIIGTEDLSAHIASILEQNTDDSKIRASRLQTKTAVLKLGANSETELSYLKGKALDGRNASYLALNHGIVAGGGVALMNASVKLPDTIGGNILKRALLYPISQIRENAHVKEPMLFAYDGYTEEGIDANTGKHVNMFEIGVIDPSIVVKNSLTNALSVASTILTVNSVITKAL